MSTVKVLLTLLIAMIILPSAGGGSAQSPDDLPMASTSANVTQGDEFAISILANEQHTPSVAYNSNRDEYLVVWHNNWGGNQDIYSQRLNGKGQLLSWFSVGPTAPLNPYPNDRVQPSVAYDSNEDRYLVVWAYDTFGDGTDWDIHGVFVDWNGPIAGLHQINICDWSTHQWTPKVAYSPVEKEFMIVWWTDHPSVPGYISGRRMNAGDGTLNPSSSNFTISHTTEERVNPEIAYNIWHNEYLVVYHNTNDIYGSRYNSEGTIQGSEFGIATWPDDETQPSVAYCWKNDHYLVAWQNPQPDIYARFITGGGIVTNDILHLAYTSIAEILPQVACGDGGNQFLAVWQQQYSSGTGPFGVRGQYINTDMALGEDFEIIAPTSGVAAEFTAPTVAGGKPNFLTVWEHDRAGTAYQDIYGRLSIPYALFVPMMLRNY